MLKNLEYALSDLEIAFNSKKVTSVSDKTNLLSKELEIFKNTKDKSLEKTNLDDTTKLIEKLSIHNEFKLNLLKEYTTYVSNKK